MKLLKTIDRSPLFIKVKEYSKRRIMISAAIKQMVKKRKKR